MSDDFAVVREKLTNEPWFDEAEAALDRIEARLKSAEDKAFRMEQKLGSALDERDEAQAKFAKASKMYAYVGGELDKALANAERLAEALRLCDKVAETVRPHHTGGRHIQNIIRAALATHGADPDSDYLHGIGVKC